MGQWLSWIKSNEKELLTILDNLAKKAVETSEAVVILFNDLSNTEQAKKIHELETEADVLTRDIFSELNKTFITPLDREDMQRIASKIDDVIDFIENSRKKFKTLPPEEISFPRSASDVVKYKAHATIYSKGTPIHIRGALLYNYYVKKHKLDNKYSLIQNGEKIKFCYLKKPNIIHENIISFIQDFPHEIGLDKYVDYDLQFDKAFLEPLKSILDAIGWNVEKTVNLESFFT